MYTILFDSNLFILNTWDQVMNMLVKLAAQIFFWRQVILEMMIRSYIYIDYDFIVFNNKDYVSDCFSN